jgi:hypothetical protein
MRKTRIAGDFLKGFLPSIYRGLWFTVLFLFLGAATLRAAEKIAVFPSTPYEGFIIYESLAVFWLFIVGLLVIIRMKLQEIERIQQLGAEQEDPNAPLLD